MEIPRELLKIKLNLIRAIYISRLCYSKIIDDRIIMKYHA